jgi:hypothetical protein
MLMDMFEAFRQDYPNSWRRSEKRSTPEMLTHGTGSNSLKGPSAIGAQQCTPRAYQLETMGRRAELDGASPSWQLEQELERLGAFVAESGLGRTGLTVSCRFHATMC